jgi:hypothetical protein
MYKISRNLALFLLKYNILNENKSMIVCKGYAADDCDFVEVGNDDYDSLKDDTNYSEFEIWIKELDLNPVFFEKK